MSQNPLMDVILAIVCYHKDCNEEFDNEAERDAHEKTHLTCTYCSRGFDSVADRIDHETAHITCYYGYCGLQFQNEDLRMIHVQTEHFHGTFMCTFCWQSYGDALQWRACEASHVAGRGWPEVYWVCSEPSIMDGKPCNTSYTSAQGTNYKNHVRNRHRYNRTEDEWKQILDKTCFKHSGFWCGRCGKGLKYDDPAIKRDLKLHGIGQSLRLDHIQKHVLEDGGIHWQWPSSGV
ncbi:hypothetical protein CFIO01_05344 [Colletotrichum fioriniae PJ7]|uniref:C2H2-type domain-containing protein n=1 Tax=Colletotrichum fioriniae PJ7 TaxID=1445577 RepID=A0A010RU00_9PEZI|nr:hypothetical protein CFIO01_05344 [Colletotrichum fioriniae PJ7]